jgi:hypothetical protein
LNADGSLTAVGASGESLLKVKPISNIDYKNFWLRCIAASCPSYS